MYLSLLFPLLYVIAAVNADNDVLVMFRETNSSDGGKLPTSNPESPWYLCRGRFMLSNDKVNVRLPPTNGSAIILPAVFKADSKFIPTKITEAQFDSFFDIKADHKTDDDETPPPTWSAKADHKTDDDETPPPTWSAHLLKIKIETAVTVMPTKAKLDNCVLVARKQERSGSMSMSVENPRTFFEYTVTEPTENEPGLITFKAFDPETVKGPPEAVSEPPQSP